MTSIAAELGAADAPGVACFRKEMAYRFSDAHGRRARLVTPHTLGIKAPLAAAPAAPVLPASSAPRADAAREPQAVPA
jgi:hypothetical protein